MLSLPSTALSTEGESLVIFPGRSVVELIHPKGRLPSTARIHTPPSLIRVELCPPLPLHIELEVDEVFSLSHLVLDIFGKGNANRRGSS